MVHYNVSALIANLFILYIYSLEHHNCSNIMTLLQQSSVYLPLKTDLSMTWSCPFLHMKVTWNGKHKNDLENPAYKWLKNADVKKSI